MPLLRSTSCVGLDSVKIKQGPSNTPERKDRSDDVRQRPPAHAPVRWRARPHGRLGHRDDVHRARPEMTDVAEGEPRVYTRG